MEKDLIIIGAGGLARQVAWIVERINADKPTWKFHGFLDDAEELKGTDVDGYPVLGICDEVAAYPDAWFVCAIGSARVRKKVIGKITNMLPSIKFATLLDPSVLISNRVTIGEGTIICAGSIVTVDISIGRHVFINWNCTIGHDVVLEDFVTLCPSVNVAGFTKIGECCEMGSGSRIIQSKKICSGSIIGAGATVVKDISEPGTYVGVPAKRMQKNIVNLEKPCGGGVISSKLLSYAAGKEAA